MGAGSDCVSEDSEINSGGSYVIQAPSVKCPMCHDLILESNMHGHDCRHEYVYVHGVGFKAAEIHEKTVKALMKRHNVRRNDKCFCHSGLKFKKCCGAPRTALQLQGMINERLENLPRRVSDVSPDFSV